MNALGRHVLVELYDCDPQLLNDVNHVEKSMVAAAEEAGATVINSTFHHFSPIGVSGVVVIEESHLAIHSWPEFGYAAIDVFTCGDSVDPWISYKYLEEALKAGHGSSMELLRGQEKLLTRKDIEAIKRDQIEQKESRPTFKRNVWFTERDENVAFSLRYDGETLFSKHSDFQKVEVINTYAYGKMLTLDGLVMCTENDEYVYHEMITHVGMLSHPNPKQVLVIGGGDGGTVRELVKHPSLEKVTMVEIDDVVIEASKQNLPSLSSAFDHEKLDLIVGDGIEYLAKCPANTFDLIIIDNSDPVGPSEGIFTKDFYSNAYKALTENGILVGQSESPRFNQKVYKELYGMLRGIFSSNNVHCMLGYVPTYPSGMWSWSFCSKQGIDPVKDIDEQKIKDFVAVNQLSYYNEAIHRASFALPNFAKALLDE
jgi:spermidine synthase